MIKLPPPVWALIFALLAGAVSAAWPWRRLIDLRLLPVGAVLLAGGLALSVWAALIFRVEGTELNPTSPSNKKLVIRGPFRWTRNPMYLSIVIFTLGLAFAVGSLPMFAVPVLVLATASLVHIPFEEAKMRRQFGTAFDDYAARVRRWL